MNTARIEQLLERYWLCETTVSEEKELRSFFLQENVPQHLLKYKPLFEIQQGESEEKLDNQFDEKVLRMIKEEDKKTTRTFNLRPFLQIAASIAVILTLWFSIQLYNQQTENDPWKHDTYSSPEQALAEVEKVLSFVSVKMERSQELIMEKMEKAEPLTQIIKK